MNPDKATGNAILRALYHSAELPAHELEELVDGGRDHVRAELSALSKVRLVDLLGSARGPYSYRLSPACRACLEAIGRTG